MMKKIAVAFRRAIVSGVVLTLWFSPLAQSRLASDPISFKSIHSYTTVDIVRKLEQHHYEKEALDDAMSSAILDRFLDRLDSNRNFFLQADIDEFETYRLTLDDDLKRGRLQAAAVIYSRYSKRVTERLEKIIAELPTMMRSMDFTRDEVLLLDRDESVWPSTKAEADDLWRQQLKSSVLSLRLSDKEMPAIEELLLKRYSSQLNRVRQVNSEDIFELYINSLTELYDPHTNYFSPRTSENFNMQMRLSLEGIGAVLQQEDEYTKVVRLVHAGPADKQGQLQPADRITGVAQGVDGDIVDVIGWRLDEVVDLIRGPKDTLVRLEVLPGDGGPDATATIISIVRNEVRLEEQAAQSRVLDLYHEGGMKHVGIIDIPTFYEDFEAMRRGDPNYRSTTRDVRRLLDELIEQAVAGVVIDLRNNGGGSLREAEALTSMFIETGPTVQIRHSNAYVDRRAKNIDNGFYAGPLVVLINRLSASASEIFAGAIQDYNRGLIVGSQSFGKGTVQSLTPLRHGQLKLTESKFYRISGDSTQHRGIVPDIDFPSTFDIDLVGESALDNALPWDRIRAVKFDRFEDLDSLVPVLKTRHQMRIDKDPDFLYLREELALADELSRRNIISLNEATRRTEREQRRQRELENENRLRAAKGMSPLPMATDKTEETADVETEVASAPDSDASEDVLLIEAGQILLDSVFVSRELVSSQRPTIPGS